MKPDSDNDLPYFDGLFGISVYEGAIFSVGIYYFHSFCIMLIIFSGMLGHDKRLY